MARFVRDEKKTYPFTWLLIGSLFAGSALWAAYAEMSSRVPWQTYQEDFYEFEFKQAKAALDVEQERWDVVSQKEPLKGLLARVATLETEKNSGDYAAATKELVELDDKFAKTELQKTFGTSDLDEGYYYRNLAEYDRDAAQVGVRKAYKAAYPDDARAVDEPNAMYADPPPPPPVEGESAALHHLRSEVARMQSHRDKVNEARSGGHPAELLDMLNKSAAAEAAVLDKLELEIAAQQRIDKSLIEMVAIDGPTSPTIVEQDPAKPKLAAARKELCSDKPATRNCIRWLRIEPVDNELKRLAITIAKAQRPLKDAELRYSNAKDKADPEFSPEKAIDHLVGPLQIKQVVTGWMDFERDVDIQQVDRCQTCHMGVDRGLYTDASVPWLYRTHPRRDQLLAAHPVEDFGCTVCHQGQGRATSDLAHSSMHLQKKHGKERWHVSGDHHWEDLMLLVGRVSKAPIDARNDELEVKLGRGKASKLTLPHGEYELVPPKPGHGHGDDAHDDHAEPAEQDEAAVALAEAQGKGVLGALQARLQELVKTKELAKDWRAVVRRIDNRVQIGIEPISDAARTAKKPPEVVITFNKPGLATLLGFKGQSQLKSKTKRLHTAALPPVQPVRASDPRADGGLTADGYVPPYGKHGLQVPDDSRNTFIQALPAVESGCVRCHTQDADLIPRRSHSKYVTAKLKYQQAEAERAADPDAYVAKHGTDALPRVPEAATEVTSLAPTHDEGRTLFRQLNCNGCHLLEGFENNQNAGPALDSVAAKVTPEWLLTWLRDPRGWRAKTSMPNLWPRPLDPASKIPYPEGSPEYAKWEKARSEETLAIASYLIDRADKPAAGGESLKAKIQGYASVPGADAKKGEKIFAAYGCQGCHANVDSGATLPDTFAKRERDLAPTLSNLAAKTSADWIAYWVENPSRYWHGTAMPNLRLSRVDSASVALYLASLKSKAPAAAEVSKDEVALVTDPKQRAAVLPCSVAGGREMSRVDCGKRVIEHRGCYGCHELTGFEGLSPIGPELTGFAKKDVSTLDFGYAIADHHLQTTETFSTLKLDSPRVFVRDRIELKMGDFDLSADEIRALVVFLKGTVPSKPNEKFDPMAKTDYAAAVRGRQLVRDLNCQGCHVIEGRGGDLDGWRQDLLTQNGQLRAPWLDGEGARVQPEWLFSFLRKPGENGIRPWLHPEWVWPGEGEVPDDHLAVRMPTFNLTPDQWTDVVRYFATWDGQEYPFQVPVVPERDKDEKLWAAANMNNGDTGNCFKCHFYEEFPVEKAKGGLADMSPDLAAVSRRLRPEWVKQWLLRPHSFMPYTKMTAFFASVDRPSNAARWPKENDPYISPPAMNWDKTLPTFRKVTSDEQAELIRDLLFSIPAGAPWPAKGEEATSLIVDPAAAKLQAANPDAAEAVDGAQPAGQTGGLPGRRRF